MDEENRNHNNIVCPFCGHEFRIGDDVAEHIRSQLRTKEFDREVAERVALMRENMEAERRRVESESKAEMRDMESRHVLEMERQKGSYQSEIAELTARLGSVEDSRESELSRVRLEAEAKSGAVIARLQADLDARSREVEYYRDLKARMSTKMVGETLEQHCETAFNQIRMAAFPHAEFHKDNEVSATGSKGDYIFRESVDGTELVSIMFEMKNDMDTTATRKKNEYFFRELDKDRREKGCEYAVLVTMLEPDSELYNQGIVDVSWQYPKMYVIRPQFFIPMITLLRNAAMGAVEARRELQEMRRQDLELTRFREAFVSYRDGFGRNLEQAVKRQDEAIEEIDKAIRRLEAAKAALQAGNKQLATMDRKVSGMTVERLCSDSPSVLAGMA